MNYFIAIVPGNPGGVATYVGDVFDCRPLPATEGELLDLLRHLKWSAETLRCEPRCVVQQVEPMRFEEAERYGFILGAAQALDFRVEPARREEWQAVFRRNPAWRDLRPREFNQKLHKAAAFFFPRLEVTPETAAALSILLWAKTKEREAKVLKTESANGTATDNRPGSRKQKAEMGITDHQTTDQRGRA